MACLTIDVFHDVLCYGCLDISARMRVLKEEFDLDIRQRIDVLRANRRKMAERRGASEDAAATNLDPRAAYREVSDNDAMRSAPFDHPYSRTAALACKAAKRLGGQRAPALQLRAVPTLIIRKIGTRLVNGPREDLDAQLHAALRLAA